VIELRMIERVEGFQAELKPAAPRFAEDEALKERQVPVIAARTPYRIFTEIDLARRN
jgi:hypothetical protein